MEGRILRRHFAGWGEMRVVLDPAFFLLVCSVALDVVSLAGAFLNGHSDAVEMLREIKEEIFLEDFFLFFLYLTYKLMAVFGLKLRPKLSLGFITSEISRFYFFSFC